MDVLASINEGFVDLSQMKAGRKMFACVVWKYHKAAACEVWAKY